MSEWFCLCLPLWSTPYTPTHICGYGCQWMVELVVACDAVTGFSTLVSSKGCP